MESIPFPPPAAPTLLSTWRAQLQPWLDALQFKLRLVIAPLPTRDEMHGVWIALNYFATDDYDTDAWTHMLEALELLDLLVCVHGQIGWTLLLEMADVDRVFRVNEPTLFDATAVRPQYALELDDSETLGNLIAAFTACRRLVDVDDTPIRSRAFVQVEQLLLSAWYDQHNGQPFDRATQKRIAIKPRLRLEESDKLVRLVHELDQLALSVQHARVRWASMDSDQRRRVPNRFVMPMMDVQLLCPASSSSSHEVVDALLAVTNRNVAIANLVIHPALLADDRTEALFLKLLRTSAGRTALQRLELTSRFDLTDAIVSALCNALSYHHSCGLVELVVNGAGDAALDRAPVVWDWSWLAHAVFGTSSAHRIRSLALQVDGLQLSQVVAIRNALGHPHLPCVTGQSQPNTCGSPIQHLTLDYLDVASRPAVLELLRLVGGSLDQLTLKHYGVDSFSGEFMDTVLLYCPDLTRLDIEQNGMTLDWLYAPPADGHRRGLPETLVLEGRMDHPSTVDFFRTLQDPRLVLTKRLQHLHWSVWGGKTPPFEIMEAWLQMLQTNRLLARSEIVVSDNGASAYQLAMYQERFHAHNGEALADGRKRAFLSVLSPRSGSLLATYPLASESVKLIMDFAWASTRRICG